MIGTAEYDKGSVPEIKIKKVQAAAGDDCACTFFDDVRSEELFEKEELRIEICCVLDGFVLS